MTPIPASPPPPAELGPERNTRIMLRLIATPFPLAFIALATASLMISGAELGWFAARRPTRPWGVFLFAAGGGVALCVVGASLGKLVPAAVLGLTALRFALTGLYEVSALTGIEHVAAIVGLTIVPLAAYASLALEVENVERRTVLRRARPGGCRRKRSAHDISGCRVAGHERSCPLPAGNRALVRHPHLTSPRSFDVTRTGQTA